MYGISGNEGSHVTSALCIFVQGIPPVISGPVRGLKMKMAPFTGLVVKLPSKVLWIVTRYLSRDKGRERHRWSGTSEPQRVEALFIYVSTIVIDIPICSNLYQPFINLTKFWGKSVSISFLWLQNDSNGSCASPSPACSRAGWIQVWNPMVTINTIWTLYNWLVVYLPLWKIWKSVGMMTFPIYGNIYTYIYTLWLCQNSYGKWP